MEDLIASGSKQHLGVPLGFGDASSRRDLLVLGPMRQRPTRAALPLSASPPQATFFLGVSPRSQKAGFARRWVLRIWHINVGCQSCRRLDCRILESYEAFFRHGTPVVQDEAAETVRNEF